jgi:hypothetical protein
LSEDFFFSLRGFDELFFFLFLGFESHKVLDLLVCAGQWFLLLLDSRFGCTAFVWGCALESLRRRLRILGFCFWGCKRNFFSD